MSSRIVIAALYRFVRLDNFEDLRQPLLDFMLENNIRGTLLLAAEGINGTVSGSQESINRLLDYLRTDERLRGFTGRAANIDEVDELVEEWTSSRPRETVAATLQQARVPAAASRFSVVLIETS